MRIESSTPFSRSIRALFAPTSNARRLIGAEVELLAVLMQSGRACPITSEHGPSSMSVLRGLAASRAWREDRSAKGVPRFITPDGVVVTFEPGGQWEFVSPPCASVNELLALLRRTIDPCRDAARRSDIELVARGVDPLNNIVDVPLQLEAERYVRMSSFFETIGPSGARMMRQTAAIQVSVESGADPGSRWRLLSDVAPYLTAMFANSRRYAGIDSGLQSYRAYCWRTLDASRTGIPRYDGDASATYLEFALDAMDMVRRDEKGRHLPYREWIARGQGSVEDWERHLTTLFPEVRPRGYLEVRSMDVVAPPYLAAPLVLVAGLAYHEPTSRRLRELLPPADDALLWRVAGLGLHDAAIARVAREIVTLGLEGAAALGERVVSAAVLAEAERFFERYTLRARAPADDATSVTPPAVPIVPRLVVVSPHAS